MRRVFIIAAGDTHWAPRWRWTLLLMALMTQTRMASTTCTEYACSSRYNIGTSLSLSCSRSEFRLAINDWSSVSFPELNSLYIQCSARDGRDTTSCDVVTRNTRNVDGIFSITNQLTLNSTIGYDCIALGCYSAIFGSYYYKFANSSCYLGPVATTTEAVPTTEMVTTHEATTEPDTTSEPMVATTESTDATATTEPMVATTESTDATATTEPMVATTESTDATTTTTEPEVTSEPADTILAINTEESIVPTETPDGNIATTNPGGTGTGQGVKSVVFSIAMAIMTTVGVLLAFIIVFSCCVFMLTRHSLSRKHQRTHYNFEAEDLTFDPGQLGEKWFDVSTLAKSPATESAVSVYLHLQEKDYSDFPDPHNPHTPSESARNAPCKNEYVLDPISTHSTKLEEHRTEERGVSWEPDAVVNLQNISSAYVGSSGCGTSDYGCGTSGYGSTSANSDFNISFSVLEMDVSTIGFHSRQEEVNAAMDSPKSVLLAYPQATRSPELARSTRIHLQGEEKEEEEGDRQYFILDSPLSKGASSTREDEGYRSPGNFEGNTDYMETSLSYEDLKVVESNSVGGANIGLDRSCYDDSYIYT